MSDTHDYPESNIVIATHDDPGVADPLDETVRGCVTHDDARDYAQLMSDLQDERKARVEIQERLDEAFAMIDDLLSRGGNIP